MLLPVPVEIKTEITDIHQRLAHQYVAKEYVAMELMMRERFMPEFEWRKPYKPPETILSLSSGGEQELKNLAVGRSDGPIKWNTTLDGWRLNGDTLTVDAHHKVVGEWLQGNVRLPVRFTNFVRETWIRRGGEWKALRFDELWMKGSMDGKIMEFGRKP